MIKLNQQMNRLNEENRGLKRSVEEHKQEMDNYKKVVYNLEGKIMKLKEQNVQRDKLMTPLQPNTP